MYVNEEKFMDYIISIIISLIIIFLRFKTDILERITKLIYGILWNEKIMQTIIKIILIITPSVCYILLLKISNLLVIEKIPQTINNAKEEHYLLGIIDYLKDCVKYSPFFWLVMCFPSQDLYKRNNIEENKSNKLNTLLSNMEN
jgi:hypothetical protein